jgi:hypothetical protein
MSANPKVLIMALIQLFFLSFYAHRLGAPDLATLLPQISAVSLPIVAVLSPDGAGAFARTLVAAGFVALLTVWVAHAAFPAPPAVAVAATPVAAASLVEPLTAARYALLDTLVLMPLLIFFILNATEAAIVVLIVVVTLLGQTDRQQGKSAALSLILGNLIAGVAAGISYNVILLGNTLPFFVTVCLAATLIFAGRIATPGDRAPVYVVAPGTFVLRVRLHRALLQCGSQALDDRLSQPSRVRKEGGVSLTRCPQNRQQLKAEVRGQQFMAFS